MFIPLITSFQPQVKLIFYNSSNNSLATFHIITHMYLFVRRCVCHFSVKFTEQRRWPSMLKNMMCFPLSFWKGFNLWCKCGSVLQKDFQPTPPIPHWKVYVTQMMLSLKSIREVLKKGEKVGIVTAQQQPQPQQQNNQNCSWVETK